MKKISLLTVLLLLGTALRAVPAYNDWIDFLQPHTKQTIRILLLGDERVHWAESEEGFSLLYGEGGNLHYAQPDGQGGMEPSPYVAQPKEQRVPEVDRFLANLPQHLRFSQQQVDKMLSLWQSIEAQSKNSKAMADVIGEKRFLVILFAFQDQPFHHSKQEFQNLFNQVGYSANGATGSVHDYYYEVSHGQFSLTVDVVGPFTGVENTAFYGDNDEPYGYGYQSFAKEAVDSAAKYVDCRNYDNDHNDTLDGLHIIFAGVGEEAGGGVDKIWSHKWNIFDAPTYNGVCINVYSCSPERAGSGSGGSSANSSDLTAIGVICHELGHVFGAPDYYDTDYAGSGGEFPGLGKWDIMSSGSWNANGHTPAHHNPYTKIYIYRWATCDTLSEPQQVSLRSVTQSNIDFHRVNTSTEGDFFLIENRQKERWDAQIPGSGMVVYHIHPTAHGAWVSNYQHPQQIYILALSQDTLPKQYPSSYGDLNSAMTAFPASGYRTSLTDFTTPSFRPWSNALNNSPITYISQNVNSTIFFCFKGAEPSSSNLSAFGASDVSVRLDWQNYGNMRAMVLYSTEPITARPYGRLRVGDTLDDNTFVGSISTSNSMVLGGLESSTHYYFHLYNLLDDTTYTTSPLTADATTSGCSATPWILATFDGLDALPDCWTGDWRLASLEGQPCIAASDQRNELTVAPVDLSAYDPSASVLSFKVRFLHAEGNGSQLAVRYRASVASDWSTLITVPAETCPDGWTRIVAPLPAVSDYALLQFDFSRPINTRNTIFLDSIAFLPGYCIYAHCSEGGRVTNQGYLCLNCNDTISFCVEREPGWQFTYFYLDGKNKTGQVRDGRYQHKATAHADLYFYFTRNYGIDDQPSVLQPLRVYPNPTTGELNVECGEECVELYDMMGRRLMCTNDHRLDLSPLSNGIYVVRCGSQVQRIVKR